MRRALVTVALALAGCYSNGTMTCGRADVVGSWDGTPVMGNFVGMRVRQTFNDDGSYSIYLNEQPFAGSWSFAGNQLTISNDTSCLGAGDAVYSVNFDDTSMCRAAILDVVADPCNGRMSTLNGMSITKL